MPRSSSGGAFFLSTPYHGLVKNLALAAFRFDRHFAVDGDHIRFFTDRGAVSAARDQRVRGRGDRSPWPLLAALGQHGRLVQEDMSAASDARHSGIGRRDDEERGVEPPEVPRIRRALRRGLRRRLTKRRPHAGDRTLGRRGGGGVRLERPLPEEEAVVPRQSAVPSRFRPLSRRRRGTHRRRSSTRSHASPTGVSRAGYFVGFDYVFLGTAASTWLARLQARPLRSASRAVRRARRPRRREHVGGRGPLSAEIDGPSAPCRSG